jgi:hypothetical protein
VVDAQQRSPESPDPNLGGRQAILDVVPKDRLRFEEARDGQLDPDGDGGGFGGSALMATDSPAAVIELHQRRLVGMFGLFRHGR